MPNSKKPPMGEMAYATAFIAFQGATQLWFATGFQSGYFSWKRAVAGLVLIALAGGIWYRQRLARIGAIAVLAAGALVLLVNMLQHELSWYRLAWIAALLWCCWVIWRGYEDEETGPLDDADRHRDSVAMVALLAEPVSLDEARVAAAAHRAIGADAAVFGSGMFWAVRTPQGVLRASSAARPYFADHAAETTHADEHRAVREHNAWLSVEVAEPATTDLAAAYPVMARLLAELAPEDTLLLHAPATNEFHACTVGWRLRVAVHQPFRIPQTAPAAATP